MEISEMLQEDLTSIQSALGTTVLRSAMNQTPQAVASLLEGLEEVSAKVMENSVTPYLGTNIDIRV